MTYDGKEVADLQQKAYPDLATLTTKAPAEKVFEAAKAAIASMGMQLIDADPVQGRIEANQTSLLYGFTDDVVVRIAAGADGTKVDVRSKSRVGRSDLGQNAKRIRVFLGEAEGRFVLNSHPASDSFRELSSRSSLAPCTCCKLWNRGRKNPNRKESCR